MYEVTIEHPGIEERLFTCSGGGELRTLVYGVARAQGHTAQNDSDLIAEIGAVRSRADIEGIGLIEVHDVTVKVKPAVEIDYVCEGHADLYVGLGESVYCDGTCRPRPRFDREALVALSLDLDDADLDESGGCGACGLEAGQMCVGCGLCNCDRHDVCKRPASKPDVARQ
ncbi:hypothetical protein [Streptomyces sp. A5-4]|uniref:hypothetical protein n=1 Tax=Streptomyces sp. A5-4 TaxID=3384771 RepID=UPI003DA9C1C8